MSAAPPSPAPSSSSSSSAAAASSTLADYELPHALVGRIVKSVLPAHIQIGKETRASFTKVPCGVLSVLQNVRHFYATFG